MEAATAPAAFFSPLRAHPVELRLKIRPLRVLRRPGALDQVGLEPGGALAHPGRAPLAGALVALGAQARPGQEMSDGGETAHVQADLGDNHLRAERADARDAAQQLDGFVARSAPRLPGRC